MPQMTGNMTGAKPVTGLLPQAGGGVPIQGPGQGISLGALLPAIAQGVQRPQIAQSRGGVPDMSGVGAGLASAGQSILGAAQEKSRQQFQAEQSMQDHRNRMVEDRARALLQEEVANRIRLDSWRRSGAAEYANKAFDTALGQTDPEAQAAWFQSFSNLYDKAYGFSRSVGDAYEPMIRGDLEADGVAPAEIDKKIADLKGAADPTTDPVNVQTGLGMAEPMAIAFNAMQKLTKAGFQAQVVQNKIAQAGQTTLMQAQQAANTVDNPAMRQIIDNVGRSFTYKVLSAQPPEGGWTPQAVQAALMRELSATPGAAPLSTVVEEFQSLDQKVQQALQLPENDPRRAQLLGSVGSNPVVMKMTAFTKLLAESTQNTTRALRQAALLGSDEADMIGNEIYQGFIDYVGGEQKAREMAVQKGGTGGWGAGPMRGWKAMLGVGEPDIKAIIREPSRNPAMRALDGWVAQQQLTADQTFGQANVFQSWKTLYGIDVGSETVTDPKTGRTTTSLNVTMDPKQASFQGILKEELDRNPGADPAVIQAEVYRRMRTETDAGRAAASFRTMGPDAYEKLKQPTRIGPTAATPAPSVTEKTWEPGLPPVNEMGNTAPMTGGM